jgi:hypothetical protein
MHAGSAVRALWRARSNRRCPATAQRALGGVAPVRKVVHVDGRDANVSAFSPPVFGRRRRKVARLVVEVGHCVSEMTSASSSCSMRQSSSSFKFELDTSGSHLLPPV